MADIFFKKSLASNKNGNYDRSTKLIWLIFFTDALESHQFAAVEFTLNLFLQF